MIVFACLVAFIPILLSIIAHASDETGHADEFLFVLAGQIPTFVSIVAGMMICQDFKNNTIRNKIIIGHSRTNIYLTNLIVSLIVMLIFFIINIVVMVVVGGILMPFKVFPCVGIFKKMLLILAIETAFTSTIVFICNSMKSTGGFVLALCMHYILTTIEPFLNFIPYKHRKIREFIMEIVPSFQVTLVVYNSPVDGLPSKWLIMLISCVVITVVTTVLGIASFNKSDLK